MKIDIRLPILVRALAKGTRNPPAEADDKYFYGFHVHSAEVPEISAPETDEALGPIRFTSGTGDLTVFPAMRTYEGRLYRPLGNPSGLFDKAFGNYGSPVGIDYVVSNPSRQGMATRPVALPIQYWADWFINLHGMNTARNAKIFPPQDKLDRRSRDVVDFSTTEFARVNPDDLAIAGNMSQAQAGRLLLIDGRLWMESTKPCLSVNTSAGHNDTRSLSLDFDFMPLVSPSSQTWMRFPLSAYDEARDFALSMSRLGRVQGSFGIADALGSDLSAVDFDFREEALQAMALSIGSNLVRRSVQHEFHDIHRDSPPLFEGAELARFLGVKAAVLSNNDIIGERSDLVALLPDITELWGKVKSSVYPGLGMTVSWAQKKVMEEVTAYLDDASISLTPLAQPRP